MVGRPWPQATLTSALSDSVPAVRVLPEGVPLWLGQPHPSRTGGPGQGLVEACP